MHDLMCFGLNAREDTYEHLSSTNPLIFRINQEPIESDIVAKAFRQSNQSTIPQFAALQTQQIVRHICQWTPNTSPWVSCTFSLPYILWEAHRRSSDATAPTEMLSVSIIHAAHKSLSHRTILAVEGLHDVQGDAVNYARAFQEVLVYGQIPREAILLTLPWDRLTLALGHTYVETLEVTCEDDKPFSKYCQRLRFALRNRDTPSARACAVEQAMQILGHALYPQARSLSDLEVYTEHIYHLARCLFAWPYRHPSYKVYQPSLKKPLVDTIFPQLREELLDAITSHQKYRRTALDIHLVALQEQITLFRSANSLPFMGMDASHSKQLAHDVDADPCFASLRAALAVTLGSLRLIATAVDEANEDQALSQQLTSLAV